MDDNCTITGIEKFPHLFTDTTENYELVIASFAISLYAFLALAMVCEEYLAFAMIEICYRLDMTIVMADATLLAFGTSLPELCICIICINVAKTNAGYCMVLGSVAFDSFAVVGLCGLVARERLTLDWWTTSRDCGGFCFAVIGFVVLTLVGTSWYIKSMLLITFYVIYIIYLSCDKFIQDQLRDLNDETPRRGSKCFRTYPAIVPVMREKFAKYGDDETLEITLHPCRWPKSGLAVKVLWIISWPLQVLFILTIPDCRRKSARSCFVLTVLMCIIWVMLLSYIVTWAVTIFSYQLRIPVSVVGLTLLAIGAAAPDILSFILMVHQANSARGIYYAWTINNIKMFLYLGVAYTFEVMLDLLWPTKFHIIPLSMKLIFMTALLCFCFFIMYIFLLGTRFVINRWIGCIFILIYFVYIIICTFIQIEWGKIVNKPFCVHVEM
ncbi:probable sodium/potassium/calcium exchanger CG1090 [Zeugodacus cucurbitae]|uniref:probable sodium/potassium/calcium exchanger CG1090 n=1 Tax=Zeugodacus cucurbitae TaxID=28588 RepID=UPI0010A74BD2|nr:probable sodium/potassium/calcium exchanger CG1090 [Zeugodacus cucurbitae]